MTENEIKNIGFKLVKQYEHERVVGTELNFKQKIKMNKDYKKVVLK